MLRVAKHGAPPLEPQSESDLNVTRRAEGVGDGSHAGLADRRGGQIELRVIQDIEQLAAKL